MQLRYILCIYLFCVSLYTKCFAFHYYFELNVWFDMARVHIYIRLGSDYVQPQGTAGGSVRPRFIVLDLN